MRNKKWLIIGIISVLFILLEAAAAFFYVLPYIFKNKMFDALKAGNGDDAAWCYYKVDYFAGETVDEEIKGFLITETNDYLRGNCKYADTIKRVRATESISAFKGKNLEYLENITLTECISILEETYNDYKSNEGANAPDLSERFFDAYKLYDSSGKSLCENYQDSDVKAYEEYLNTGLDNCLKAKYAQYQSGSIALEDINDYVLAAEWLFTDREYVNALNKNVSQILYYEEKIEKIEKSINAGEFRTAYETAKDVYENPAEEEIFADYKSSFKALMDDSYNKFKEDGLAKALESAKAGDEETAYQLMDELREVCGRDVKFTEIEKYLTPKWVKAYVDYTAKLDENLGKRCKSNDYVATYVEGKNTSICSTEHLEYEEFKPDKLIIADLDGNGIPEIVYMSSLTCYVVTYADNEVKLVTLCIPMTGMGEDGVIIYGGNEEKGGFGTIKISGDTAIFTHFVYYDGISYYRNGYGEDNRIDKSDYDAEYMIIKSQNKYELPAAYALGDVQKAIDDYRKH